MTDSPLPQSIADLRQRMDRGLAAFLAELDLLTSYQLLGPRDAVGWNIRDHLVHLAVWADGIAALLRREDRWAAMGVTLSEREGEAHDYDLINEQIANQHRTLSPTEARNWLIAAHGRLAAALEPLNDAALAEPYDRYVAPFSGQTGDPIVRYIANNTYEHYAEHLPWIQAIAQA